MGYIVAKKETTAASKDDLSEIATTEQLSRNLYAIGTAVLAIRKLGVETINGGDSEGAITLGVMALAEKAGYLTDHCLRLIGDTAGILGDFDEWAEIAVPRSVEESHV